MTIKFYTDTHIAKTVTTQLRRHGVDILRCEDVDLAEVSDEKHLEYAATNGRVLVSHDRDFLNLHAEWQFQGKDHAGIMWFNKDLQGNIGRIVTEILEYHQLIDMGAGTAQDMINRFLEIRE